jgi:hypothetical protein
MTNILNESLARLFGELVDGPAGDEAYMLNRGDGGLLKSLDTVSASEASTPPPSGGAPIAAHVDHLRYGLELMNRWSGGERNPWATADWTASWRRTTVNEMEWSALRGELRDQAARWQGSLAGLRDLSPMELNGTIGSVAHLAYHLGAIRQIAPATRGPKA